MCQLIGLSLYFFNNFTTSHNLSCTYLVSFHPLFLSHPSKLLGASPSFFSIRRARTRAVKLLHKKALPIYLNHPTKGNIAFFVRKSQIDNPFRFVYSIKVYDGSFRCFPSFSYQTFSLYKKGVKNGP